MVEPLNPYATNKCWMGIKSDTTLPDGRKRRYQTVCGLDGEYYEVDLKSYDRTMGVTCRMYLCLIHVEIMRRTHVVTKVSPDGRPIIEARWDMNHRDDG